MNVQQMQDAVYEGVYAAVVAAMRGNGEGNSSQVVKVFLDGKEVASSAQKHSASAVHPSWATRSTHIK